MAYYVFIQNEKINGCGQCKTLTKDILNIEVTEEIYNNIEKYTYKDGEIVLNPNYDEEKLTEAKEQKMQIAKDKAYDFLANGNALFEFEENKHIEATDGNIAKFTAYLIGFEKGLYEVVRWNTKEDENVELNFEQVAFILQGLANVQSDVWTFKYPYFLEQIELAQTVEEVENIVIDYNIEVERGEDETRIN